MSSCLRSTMDEDPRVVPVVTPERHHVHYPQQTGAVNGYDVFATGMLSSPLTLPPMVYMHVLYTYVSTADCVVFVIAEAHGPGYC